MVDHEPLQAALTRSRVAPDYTMGTLTKRTGIPPATLRTWERRYQFPEPLRTSGQHRLYSERDLVAVEWILAQTRGGQRVQQAVAMVKAALAEIPEETQSPISPPEPHPTPPSALETLIARLVANDLATAQDAWDDVVLTISVPAIGEQVVIPALRRIGNDDAPALAYLERKATVLLDAAGPDSGNPDVAFATDSSPHARIAATVLAAALARAGMRVRTPFLDARDMTGLTRLRHRAPDHLIAVFASEADADLPDTLRAVSGLESIIIWSPCAESAHAAPITTVLDAIRRT